jgi:hypothetical protein
LIGAKPPLDFKAIFQQWVDGTNKKWGHDRNKTLGGSEAFGCLRKAWYKRNGTEPDADYEESWGALRRGDIIENHIVVPAMYYAMQELKLFEFLMGGENQITLFDGDPEDFDENGRPEGVLSVTPDGLIRGVARNALSKYGIADLGTDCFMLEVKSIDPRVDLAEEKAIHHGQTQIQMGLMRQTTAFKPNYAVLLYINASFLDDIEVFIVKYDAKKFKVAQDRATLVFKTTDPSKLHREGVIDGTCQYCPYQGSCLDTTVKAMPGKTTDKKASQNPELLAALNENELLFRRRAATKAEKKAKAELAALNEEIKEVLRRYGSTKAAGNAWSVSYTMAQGRQTLDKASLIDAGINVDDHMKLGNPYEILKVTFKDLEDDDA